MAISSDRALQLLLVEDNPGDARLFEHHLETSGSSAVPPTEVTHVEALEPAFAELESTAYDLVLLDLGLPESSGLDTLDRYLEAVGVRSGLDRVPVVVLTGLKDESVSLAAIERGAQDYLVKDEVNTAILNRTIRHAMERHEQEAELRRQNERLEQFANVVSHDLRNPLNVAKLNVEMIEDEHADTVRRNLDRMEAIVEDVLAIARTGQKVKDTEEVDISVLAEAAWDQVETGAATLRCEGGRVVEADPSRCQQLLENLLRNAIEHGGEDVTIRIHPHGDGFAVEDDGPGIPEEDRNAVFDAGFTTNEDGTGFGLNIVEEIAGAHGWSVSVTEGEDGGARFEFTGIAPETPKP